MGARQSAWSESPCPCLNRGKDDPRGAAVVLSTGAIVGSRRGNIIAYSSIPFAAPPIGSLRWQRPQAAIPWKGVLNCEQPRAAVPIQEEYDGMKKDGRYISEDCLHACVWAPVGDAKKNKLPVLVWIYGGGFMGGGIYGDDGDFGCYAERGIVVVACNYRVGALGFLWPEGGSANCAMWDQIAALKWVQKEIGAFGGDCSKVTIMGQSAGADSVYFLCCSPVTKGLFHRAIIQSPASFALTAAQSRELTKEFAEVAGAKSDRIADMQAISTEAILKAQRARGFRLHSACGPGWRFGGGEVPKFEPFPDPTVSGLFRFPTDALVGWPMPTAVIDGEFLTEQPLDMLAHGAASHLEIIIGANRDEDLWFSDPDDPSQSHPDQYGCRITEGREEVICRLAWELAGMPKLLKEDPVQIRERVERIICRYEVERSKCLEQHPWREKSSNEQWLMDSALTDFSFMAATQLIIERLAAPEGSKKVYRYQFQGHGDAFPGAHAAENQLLFGLDSQNKYGKATVRTEWQDSWVAFVHTGNPNTPKMDRGWTPVRRLKDDLHATKPTIFWDGIDGWSKDRGEYLGSRVGLMAVAQLWEELWGLESAAEYW